MTVRQLDSGMWAVVDRQGTVLGEFPTNAAAWRWIEREENEPLSPAEHRQNYGFRKFVNGD